MKIEQFIANSQGKWKSMRSAHSLAFQQFEQIISTITIKILDPKDSRVLDLISSETKLKVVYSSPFLIKWEAESDWESDSSLEQTSGSSILIPIQKTNTHGKLIRSIVYAEPIQSISTYSFLNDGTLTLTTEYQETITEERIWFVSKNVR